MFGSTLIFGAVTNSAVCWAQRTPDGDAKDQPASTSEPTAGETSADSKQETRKVVSSSTDDPQDYDTSLKQNLARRFLKDQESIWTFPTRLRASDADWIMPLGLVSAGFFATDTEFSKHLSNSPSRMRNSNTFSNVGLGAFAGIAGGLYLWGNFTHDDHKRETGFLAAEAAANSLSVVYALKYSLGRERPLNDDYAGNFRAGGDSFPSEHAAAAWSIATVVAHEYPGLLTQFLAYGMASAVSVSRLTAKEHFPSDVLIGSAIGWLSGEIVYRAHHDPEVGGSVWPSPSEARNYLEHERPRQNMGTTSVPLDRKSVV